VSKEPRGVGHWHLDSGFHEFGGGLSKGGEVGVRLPHLRLSRETNEAEKYFLQRAVGRCDVK